MKSWLSSYADDSVVHRAHKLATEVYRGMTRKSGVPYLDHCTKIAGTLHEWNLDEITIAAGLLHNIYERAGYTPDMVVDRLGPEIAFLLDRLAVLKSLIYTGRDGQAEPFRKLMIAMAQDLRVIFIKLADKLEDMRTLHVLESPKQIQVAQKITDIYVPIAYRLGMQKLSGDLEDLAFPYLHSQEHQWLLETVQEHYDKRRAYAERVRPLLTTALREEGIEPLWVDARAKRYASLYKKLKRYNMDVTKVHDLVALRVGVADVSACYQALGVIHTHWAPLNGRIKDYIALPKPNGYQSLHTTVSFVDDRITEIQIRTQGMHEEAELGAAAHWAYQQSKNTKQYVAREVTSQKNQDDLLWVAQLRSWQQHLKDQQALDRVLRAGFFRDQIFVRTPDHDVITLPTGATPIDFAYTIHSEIGDMCVGAEANGITIPLDHRLSSGDVVKIRTQKGKGPSDKWLDFVVSSIARSHIQSALRAKNRSLRDRFGDAY